MSDDWMYTSPMRGWYLRVRRTQAPGTFTHASSRLNASSGSKTAPREPEKQSSSKILEHVCVGAARSSTGSQTAGAAPIKPRMNDPWNAHPLQYVRAVPPGAVSRVATGVSAQAGMEASLAPASVAHGSMGTGSFWNEMRRTLTALLTAFAKAPSPTVGAAAGCACSD